MTLQWFASPVVRGTEVCNFDYLGRRYQMRRDVAGQIVGLSKRERTNARGTFFSPLNLKGKAAKAVLAAVTA